MIETCGKMNKSFFFETTNMTEVKLTMNDQWMVPYKVDSFHVDQKSKMTATAGKSLKQDSYVKNVSKNYLGQKKKYVFTVTRPTLFFSRRP